MLNVTVPAGGGSAADGTTGVTVAVKVAGWPNGLGFGFAVTAVAVRSLAWLRNTWAWSGIWLTTAKSGFRSPSKSAATMSSGMMASGYGLPGSWVKAPPPLLVTTDPLLPV